jgi:hypothetical protein
MMSYYLRKVLFFFIKIIFLIGLGLIRGDIIGELNKKDSEAIINLTRDFYTRDNLLNNVLMFNREPEKFDHEEHVKYCLKYYE